VLNAVRGSIEHRGIIGNQKAKDFFVHKVATVRGKTRIYVVALMRQIG
jgi:hypothetical protein